MYLFILQVPPTIPAVVVYGANNYHVDCPDPDDCCQQDAHREA